MTASLHGREAELAACTERLAEAERGAVQSIVIESPAGLGKTRLLQELTETARERGMRCIWSESLELFSGQPFASLFDLARAIAEDPRDIFPDDGGGAGGVNRLLEAIEREALARPLLLVFDDTQWADDASIQALWALFRRLVDLPVCFAFGVRPLPRSPRLAALLDGLRGGLRLQLEPLDDDAIRAIAAEEFGGSVDGMDRLLEQAGGNPLFAAEVVRAAKSAQRADRPIRDDLGAVVLRRLDALPELTRELVTLSSILGFRFGLQDAAALLERPLPEVLGAVQPALEEGVLVDDPASGKLRFAHALIHDSLYDNLPGAVRTALHRVTASRLAAAKAPAAEVAHHYVRCATQGDREAIDWLVRAAREAVEDGPRHAADLLAQAIDLLPPGDARRTAFVVDRLDALVAAALPNQAERLARAELLRMPSGPGADELRRVLAEALYTEGRWADHVRAVETFVAEGVDPATEVRLRSWGVSARVFLFDLAGSAEDEQFVVEHAPDGDPFPVVTALAGAGLRHLVLRDVGTAVSKAMEAHTLASRDGRAATLRQVYGSVPAALIAADRLGDAERHCRDALARADAHGAGWSGSTARALLGDVHYARGDWDPAVAEYQVALEDAVHVTLPQEAAARAGLARIALHRGDFAGADEQVQSIRAIIDERGPQWGAERLPELRALQREIKDSPEAVLEKLLTSNPFCRLALRLALTAADETGLEVLANVHPPATLEGRVLRARAGGEGDDLIGELRALEDRVRAVELRECLGLALVDDDQGRQILTDVHDTWLELGASHDAARVAATLREVGVKLGPRSPQARADHGWEAITPTEWKVIELVDEGLTYAEIGERLYISHRTVGTHLQHVYRKLDISSRAELAAQYRQRQA